MHEYFALTDLVLHEHSPQLSKGHMSCSKGLHSGWQHEFQKRCSWWSITALFRGELEILRHFFIASLYKHHWKCHLPKNFQDSCRNSGPRLPKLLSWHVFLVADKGHVYLKKICWNVHNERFFRFRMQFLAQDPCIPKSRALEISHFPGIQRDHFCN